MIRKIFSKIRDGIACMKFYVQRSSSYLAVINASMILFLLLSNLNERGIIEANLDKYFVVLLIFGLLGLIGFGALDIHIFKANQKEQVLNFKYNPAMMGLKKKLEEISDKIGNLERRLEDLKNKNG